MEIKLSPELEAVVERGVTTGGYASAEEYLSEAIDLMRQEEQRERLEVSWGQAQRGELLTEHEVREHLKATKAAWAERGR